jgi:hypothetical protein
VVYEQNLLKICSFGNVGPLRDASALPVSGAHTDTGNTALSQSGDARAAGEDLSEPPRAAMKILFQVIELLVDVT